MVRYIAPYLIATFCRTIHLEDSVAATGPYLTFRNGYYLTGHIPDNLDNGVPSGNTDASVKSTLPLRFWGVGIVVVAFFGFLAVASNMTKSDK